ncbi:hypothetical protein FKM82_024973 [Ascaphus truei]
MDTLYVCGVDDMSTQDIFGFFKRYPPGHIEWLDDSSCNVVWLDEVTATRALLNLSSTTPDVVKRKRKKHRARTSSKTKKGTRFYRYFHFHTWLLSPGFR